MRRESRLSDRATTTERALSPTVPGSTPRAHGDGSLTIGLKSFYFWSMVTSSCITEPVVVGVVIDHGTDPGRGLRSS